MPEQFSIKGKITYCRKATGVIIVFGIRTLQQKNCWKLPAECHTTWSFSCPHHKLICQDHVRNRLHNTLKLSQYAITTRICLRKRLSLREMYFLPRECKRWKSIQYLSVVRLPVTPGLTWGSPRERWICAQTPQNIKLMEIGSKVLCISSLEFCLSLGNVGREIMLFPSLNSCKQGSANVSGHR